MWHLFTFDPIGNYHPAMGLKAQIDKLEGQNSELRGQIRKARLEEDKLISHLQRAKTKITGLEKENAELKVMKSKICWAYNIPA